MKRGLLLLLAACRAGGGDDGSGGGIAPIPLEVAAYPDGSGRMLRATVVVNGSAPIPVLVDTHSVGLRVFAADLADVTVETTPETTLLDLGGNDRLAGHVARATVQLGAVQLPGPLAFAVIDQIDCTTDCTAALLAAGIHGFLGIGMRAGSPPSLYSPLAQLTGFSTYAIHTGGFESLTGAIELGAVPANYTTHDLTPIDTLPDGLPAWDDDGLDACYTVGGSPIDPPCTPTAIASAARLDTIYAPGLPAGALPDGTAFAATIGSFATDFTAGTTPSQDVVRVDPTTPHATLGVEMFLRYDVFYDLGTGAIGFRAN